MAEQAQSVQERLENYLLAEEAEANPEREEPKDAVREEPQEETASEANAEAEVEEVQKGYTVENRLIRPAMVKVAKKPHSKDKK